jgi:hypothetical protein
MLRESFIPTAVRLRLRVAHAARGLLAAAAVAACTVPSATQSPGGLPRRGGALERIPGVESAYGALTTGDGLTLRTIVTRPRGATGRLPGVLFVRWLSCDTIELPESSRGGWSRMLRRLIQDSGAVVWRTEKAGVGDSEGECATLDYDRELAHHRQALAKIDRSRRISALFEVNPISEHDRAVEREAGLRTVPGHELADRVIVGALPT